MATFFVNKFLNPEDPFIRKYLTLTNTQPQANSQLKQILSTQKPDRPRVWIIDDYVVKMNDPDDDRDDVLHEAFVGMVINQMKNPNYVETICSFNSYIYDPIALENGHRGKIDYIVVKFVEGISFRMFARKLSVKKIIRLYIYIVFQLRIMFEACQFTHYDLHPGNILIVKRPKTIVTTPWGYFQSNYHPVFIDFGRSHIRVNGVSYGRTVKRQAAYPVGNPMYDVYFILERILLRYHIDNPDVIKLRDYFGTKHPGGQVSGRLFRDMRTLHSNQNNFHWEQFLNIIRNLSATKNWLFSQ